MLVGWRLFWSIISLTAETPSMPTLKFLVIYLDLFLCCALHLNQTAVFLSASPLCSMFTPCVCVLSQALFCKAKQSSFSSLLWDYFPIPFFICSPCSLCVLCAQFLDSGKFATYFSGLGLTSAMHSATPSQSLLDVSFLMHHMHHHYFLLF